MTRSPGQTMEDFARLLGLSRPTVSRYFNDKNSVRQSTRRIIEDGIQKYDYHPSFLAASLTRGRAKAIGIIVPSIVDAFFSDLVSVIEIEAEQRGFLTVLQSSHNDPVVERRALSRLLSLDVAGIAMAPLGYTSDVGVITRAMDKAPIVFMDSRLAEGIPFIGTDNQQSVFTMVDYLCRSGTPPALFTMPPANVNVLERRQAYVRRMQELGHEVRILNPDQGPIGDDYERYGYERFLTLSPEVMAGVSTILCPNDRVAFGLMAAVAKLGLKIGNRPGDAMRIAGHDGQRFGAYAIPSLTTCAQNTRAIGEAVARALLDPAVGLPGRDYLFDGVLLCRDSA